MRRLFLLPLLLIAACTEKAATPAAHPLDGSWNQAIAGGKKGITIEFNPKNDQCALHGAPRADGSHAHASGTYTFDIKTGAMTMDMKLLEDKAATAWTGTLVAGKLSLSSADGKLEFATGAAAH